MSKAVFRIPTPALLAAGLAAIAATPFAWGAPGLQAVYLLPIGFAVWVLRNRTTVDGERLVARSTFGTRVVPWDEVKAIKLAPKGWLSAVLRDDSLVRLPAVRAGHLPTLALVSGGRVADPSAGAEANATPNTDDGTEANATPGTDGDTGPGAGSGGSGADGGDTPPPVKSGE
ncbi:MAG: PH domain-containing protein [Saccharothrix sp.]|nr:PH domain-containing protein [Saccharothrix sp.]